jgi:hypothetical protein
VVGKVSTFQEFKNLRNLVLYKCDLSDYFRTLEFFLQSSPFMEKLTLRQCQVDRAVVMFFLITSYVTMIVHRLTAFILHTVPKVF